MTERPHSPAVAEGRGRCGSQRQVVAVEASGGEGGRPAGVRYEDVRGVGRGVEFDRAAGVGRGGVDSKPLNLRRTEVPLVVDSGWLRCGGEVLRRQCPGFERGDVPVDGVLAQMGAVVLDLDEAEDACSGSLNRSPRPWCSGRRGRGCGRD